MKRLNIWLRLVIALFIVLPVTLLLMAATTPSSPEDGPLERRFLNLLLAFLAVGPVLAIVLSLVHSLLERVTARNSRLGSITLATFLGLLTVVPLVLEKSRFVGVLYGGFAGITYGILVNLRSFSPSRHPFSE